MFAFCWFLLLSSVCMRALAQEPVRCSSCFQTYMCPTCRSKSDPSEMYATSTSIFQPDGCSNVDSVPECGGNSFPCHVYNVCPGGNDEEPTPAPTTEVIERTTQAPSYLATLPSVPAHNTYTITTTTIGPGPPADVPSPPPTTTTSTTIASTQRPVPGTTYPRSFMPSSSMTSSPTSSPSPTTATTTTTSPSTRLTLPDVPLRTGDEERTRDGTSDVQLISSQNVINIAFVPPAVDNATVIGAIVGGVLGCLLLLGILATTIAFAKRRRHDIESESTVQTSPSPLPSAAVATSPGLAPPPISFRTHDYASMTLPNPLNRYDEAPQMATEPNLYDQANSTLHM
jgi:hypothetical protein